MSSTHCTLSESQSSRVTIGGVRSEPIHDHPQGCCRTSVVEGVHAFCEVHLGCIHLRGSILFDDSEVQIVAAQWLIVEEDLV